MNIIGYRELTREDIDLINEIKSMGVELQALIDKLNDNFDVDQRWTAIGKTALQQGLMALTRAVAKPDSF
jgi:hypothetical protein